MTESDPCARCPLRIEAAALEEQYTLASDAEFTVLKSLHRSRASAESYDDQRQLAEIAESAKANEADARFIDNKLKALRDFNDAAETCEGPQKRFGLVLRCSLDKETQKEFLKELNKPIR